MVYSQSRCHSCTRNTSENFNIDQESQSIDNYDGYNFETPYSKVLLCASLIAQSIIMGYSLS